MATSPILIRSAAVLAKIEVTPGTDVVPTGIANAIKVSNLSVTPLQMEFADRAVAQPYLGNSDQVEVSAYSKVAFDVEIAGAGEPGTAPQYGPLLRGCGFAEEVVDDTSVVYTPRSTGFESLSIYTNVGGVLYKMTFAAGTVSLTLNAGGVPQFHFEFSGLYLPVTDAVLPTVTYRDVKPLAITKANTPSFSLLGYQAKMKQLTLDMKNAVSYRNLVNEESVRLGDRKPDGTVSMEAVKVADKDWWASIRGGTVGALAMTHGTVAGNIVEIDAPGAQMVAPAFADDGGIQMMNANLVLKPVDGNDELTITVR